MKKLILLCLFSAAAWAQCSNTDYGNGFTCIQQKGTANGGSASSQVTTLSSTPTAGQQALVFGTYCGNSGCGGGNAASITATLANGAGDSCTIHPSAPWSINQGSAGDAKLYAWFCPNISANTTYTMTTSTTSWYPTLYVSIWSGVATSSFWDVGGSTATTSTVTSLSASAGTTTNATDLIAGFIILNAANAVTPGSGFTEIGEDATAAEHEAKSVAATGAQSCTWTFASTAGGWAGCVTLKAAAGGGGAVRRRVIVVQ